jgi:hypothetical protein
MVHKSVDHVFFVPYISITNMEYLAKWEQWKAIPRN